MNVGPLVRKKDFAGGAVHVGEGISDLCEFICRKVCDEVLTSVDSLYTSDHHPRQSKETPYPVDIEYAHLVAFGALDIFKRRSTGKERNGKKRSSIEKAHIEGEDGYN